MGDRLGWHPRGRRTRASALTILLVASIAGQGFAQAPPAAAPGKAAAPIPATSPGDTGAPVPDESKKAEAKAHFEKGLALLQEEAWAPALAEFLTSRELYPTRAATKNAGTALRKLQRYDESLDMFEALLRDFPNMPPEARAEAQQNVAEMRELVGTIDVRGAEPGAAIVVSGVARGEYPPVTPLRVPAGTHVVRLLKDGFEPFEAKVDVAGGQTSVVQAKLRALVDSGRLRVVEAEGRKLDVIIGGAVKGQTPWEGILPVGEVAVSLHGKGRMGSVPALVTVKSRQLTPITLKAVPLDSALRVVPTPASAEVIIDGVKVGAGEWKGELPSGKHRIGAAFAGYVPVDREVLLERGKVQNERFELSIDPRSPMWRKPSRWLVDVDAGFAILPASLGGPAACSDGCSKSLGMGALGLFHAGYELGNGFGFGLSAGYLFAAQSVSGRKETLQPRGFGDVVDTSRNGTSDDLSLSAFLGGLHVSYHLGDKVPFLARLGGGALVGQVRDERSGKFYLADGKTSYDVDHALTRAMAAFAYTDLTLRLGLRLGEHAELSAGVQALLLFAIVQPKWDSSLEVYTGKHPTKANPTPPTDGAATYKADPLVGSLLVGVIPTASFRYAF